MTFYVPNQNTVIAVLTLLGVFFGFVYDVFICLRIALRFPKAVVFFWDVLYCLAGAVIFIMAVFITNYGYIRWYEFAAAAFGFALYRIVFDRYLLNLMLFVLKTSARLVRLCIRVLFFPFAFVFGFAGKFVSFVMGKLCTYLNGMKLHRYSSRKMAEYTKLSKKGFRL